MKQIFMGLLIIIAFTRLNALEKPKKEYEKFIENNKADLMHSQIDVNSINGTFWLQNDDKHICYEDMCHVQGLLIVSKKMVFLTFSFNYNEKVLKIETIDCAYSYEIKDGHIIIPLHDFCIEKSKLIDNKKGNEYILFQAFPVNSKEQENGNNLWLELIK